MKRQARRLPRRNEVSGSGRLPRWPALVVGIGAAIAGDCLPILGRWLLT